MSRSHILGFLAGMAVCFCIGSATRPQQGPFALAVDSRCIYIMDTATSTLYCRPKAKLPLAAVANLGPVTSPGFTVHPHNPQTTLLTYRAIASGYYEDLAGCTTEQAHALAEVVAMAYAQSEIDYLRRIVAIIPAGDTSATSARFRSDLAAYEATVERWESDQAERPKRSAFAELLQKSQADPNAP
jgi:hypothetical protein